MSKYKRVVFLLVDGARPDVLNELLQKGELPAIKKYLADNGTNMEAVTAFPSTTGPAYIPFLTGCLPATCNVPGIRWIDKVEYAKKSYFTKGRRSYVSLETYLMGKDMRREFPTLFDLLPRSYNVFNSVNKGVSFWRNKTSISRIWYWYYAHLTDRWNYVDDVAIEKTLAVLKKDFDMIFTIMPGVDEYSHIVHYRNEETINAYRKADRAVSEIFAELERLGKAEDTLFWLVSDHGLSETHTHFCVNEFLEGRGIRTLYYPKIFKKNCVAANMMSGNGMTNIYFKHDHGWQYPMYRRDIDAKYPDLLRDLVSEKAVSLLACRQDPHTVEVMTETGAARIKLEGDSISYEVEGTDPFGYENMKSHLTSGEALHLTRGRSRPDALYQLAHLFSSTRVGDVILSAASGYDLRRDHEVPEHKGSHGSLDSEHMIVPVLSNAKFAVDYARTVDIFPTTLELLGHPTPANIDGTSLLGTFHPLPTP